MTTVERAAKRFQKARQQHNAAHIELVDAVLSAASPNEGKMATPAGMGWTVGAGKAGIVTIKKRPDGSWDARVW